MQLQSRSVCLIWKRLRHKFCHYKMKKSLKILTLQKTATLFFFQRQKSIKAGWTQNWGRKVDCWRRLVKRIAVIIHWSCLKKNSSSCHETYNTAANRIQSISSIVVSNSSFFYQKMKRHQFLQKKNLPPKNIGAMMICTFLKIVAKNKTSKNDDNGNM